MHSFTLEDKIVKYPNYGYGLIYFMIYIAFIESNSTDHSKILCFPLTKFKLAKDDS